MQNIERLNPEKLAIVVVDLQRGYCDPTSDAAQKLKWDVSDAERVCQAHLPFLARLRRLIPAKRIIWLKMEEAAGTFAPNMHYGPHRTEDFAPLCVRGTTGHDYHIVSPTPEEPQFLKYHFSGFNNPDLHAYLQKEGISQLAFTGVVASRCVNGTLIAATSLGYECILIEDLVSGPMTYKTEMDAHLKMTTHFYALPLNSNRFLDYLETVGGSGRM